MWYKMKVPTEEISYGIMIGMDFYLFHIETMSVETELRCYLTFALRETLRNLFL